MGVINILKIHKRKKENFLIYLLQEICRLYILLLHPKEMIILKTMHKICFQNLNFKNYKMHYNVIS